MKSAVTITWTMFARCAICVLCLQGVQFGNSLISDDYKKESSFPVSTYNVPPVPKPEVLDMVIEDHSDEDSVMSHTILPTITNKSLENKHDFMTKINKIDQSRGRAMQFDDSSTKTLHEDDLSDVSMDSESDNNMSKPSSIPKSLKNLNTNCVYGGLTYENGEKLEVECNLVCTCINSHMNCTDRCLQPYFKKGKKIDDPLCSAHDVDDPCCSILACSSNTEIKSETCTYKNITYNKNQKFEDGCQSLCSCESEGKVLCKPRCTLVVKTAEGCVEVPDPKDACCKKVFCDVTLNDHEPEKDIDEEYRIKLLSANFVNDSSIKLGFDVNSNMYHGMLEVEISANNIDWQSIKVNADGFINNITNNFRFIRIKHSTDAIPIQTSSHITNDTKSCTYKGKTLGIDEEYNDNCTTLCVCRENGLTCLKIECPTYFGLDVLNPNCIEWETVPANFVAKSPQCCPEEVRCKNTGSCIYKNETYSNWQQIPVNVTGCENRCYCEMGHVECHKICPPVTAIPPNNLECSQKHAVLDHIPDDDCCLYWTCKTSETSKGHLSNNTNEMYNSLEANIIAPTTEPILKNIYKQPSKILGPLTVYTNKESGINNASVVDKLPDLNLLPNITSDENPFFTHKSNSKELLKASISSSNNIPVSNKTPPKIKNEINSQFVGPFNPMHYPAFPTNNVESKPVIKNKPNKSSNSQVAPNQKFEFSYTNSENMLPIINKQTQDNSHQIHIHGKGDPDDLLQIIQQHPELANYPPGSVLEIQNIDLNRHPSKTNMYSNLNQNDGAISINEHKQSIPYMIANPHLLPDDNTAPQINIEHILQQIHKNPQQPYYSYPSHAQITLNNGQLVVTSPNGQINPPNPQTNLTQPGIDTAVFPGGYLNLPPNYHQASGEIIIHTLQAIDGHTVRLVFNVPPILVGLHGRVEVRYTDQNNNDPNTWAVQVFAPPSDLIETPQLEFELPGLKEDTEYKIKITVILHDLANAPTSSIYTVRTLKGTISTTLPPMIPIEPNIMVKSINSTWVNIAWRKFTDYELQFIDGVQIRYREIDGKIYAATPLIHRAVTSYTIENLKPNTKYEAGIFFIPFTGQQTELHAEHMIHFTTTDEVDTYGFIVTLDISQVKATSVEISWSGVPYPEDKYVHIYRAIYQTDSEKRDFSTFKIAKRDSSSKSLITDLKPGIRYRLWLEAYLTNGRIKTSNVQDFVTKPRLAPNLDASTQQDKLERENPSQHKGDYYGPLVIVAILAAISILSTLILLLILVKRYNQNKATINPPNRISQSAYDNPSYKVEIQQETMNL